MSKVILSSCIKLMFLIVINSSFVSLSEDTWVLEESAITVSIRIAQEASIGT